MSLKQGVAISVLSKREKALLLILAAVLLVFFHYRYILVPQIERYHAARIESDRLKKQLAGSGDIYNSILLETERVNEAGRRLEEAGVEYSIKFGESSSLFMLGRWAADNRVAITSYQSGKVASKGAYYEIPLKVGLKGGYQDLLILLDKLEEAGYFSDVRSLNIKKCAVESANKSTGEKGKSFSPDASSRGLVTAEIDMVIHSYTTAKGPAVPDEIDNWPAGRRNAFLASPELVPIVPGSAGIMP